MQRPNTSTPLELWSRSSAVAYSVASSVAVAPLVAEKSESAAATACGFLFRAGEAQGVIECAREKPGHVDDTILYNTRPLRN